MWVVINIGCIECGVSSDIVGVFDDYTTASDIVDACEEKYHWRQGGENSFEIFELSDVNIINNKYKKLMSDEKCRHLFSSLAKNAAD